MIHTPTADRRLFRLAGLLYLIIIACGLWSELAVRQPMLSATDDALADRLFEGDAIFRLSLTADLLMALCDVALAVLLFAILSPRGPLIAALATAFRLVQSAVIGANLLLPYAALHLMQTDPAGPVSVARTLMELHGTGYDIGLAFFGLSCLCTGWLVARHPMFARWLGILIAAAGAVYLAGTALRLLAPSLSLAFSPAYLVSIVAETSFCLWLLVGGRKARSTSS
ncbi:DUF4386 domain-containing protein [Tropicimonas isoalkanivorans]|uniref:DUF4386 domain-containing protein n=1 Tax=Tropicimonas isoalkanivorans TaxID=441112 RepID=A0A1I1DM28_9RHOB|nr:DUF4386 domain-containing protein [Tropicimonas isoalkanivorans]SFB76039.1 protein of unknown function [Tropicimonas isoalkanivorans]